MDSFFVGPIYALTHNMPTVADLRVLHALYMLAFWAILWLGLRLFALATHRTPTRALRRAFIGTLIVTVSVLPKFFFVPFTGTGGVINAFSDAFTTFVGSALLTGAILWILLRALAFLFRRPTTHVNQYARNGALMMGAIGAAYGLSSTLFSILIVFLALRSLLWLVVHGIGWVRQRESSTPHWTPWAVGVIAILISLPVIR